MIDPPGRPGPDSTLDSVREELIGAATDILLERGVEIGLDHIRLSDAIERTGISRATAYRSLSDHDGLEPQERLRQQVLIRLLARQSREASRDAVLTAIESELESKQSLLSSGDPAERTEALRELIRVGAAASYRAVASSRDRAILLAAYGAYRSRDPRGPEWQETQLRAGEAGITELFGELYDDFSRLFHLRLRSGFTMTQFATAAAALVEGLALREGLSDELEGIERPDRSGTAQDWTLFALGFEGLYMLFFEPDSPDEPFADLKRW